MSANDQAKLAEAVDGLMERRLSDVARTTPAFASALRAYRKATLDGDQATAQSLIAWIGGQPNVSAAAKRAAGVDTNSAFGLGARVRARIMTGPEPGRARRAGVSRGRRVMCLMCCKDLPTSGKGA